MKQQNIYLFFSLLFALQLFSQNTTQLYLKGKVKSIHETYQKCPTVALEGSTFKCLYKVFYDITVYFLNSYNEKS